MVYRLFYIASNSFGDSEPSLILTVAASELPDAPTDLTIDWALSSKTSLMVKWTAPERKPDSLITGYFLEMDRGFLGSEFTRVYDGS